MSVSTIELAAGGADWDGFAADLTMRHELGDPMLGYEGTGHDFDPNTLDPMSDAELRRIYLGIGDRAIGFPVEGDASEFWFDPNA